jgi:hypothetical protein
LALALANRHPMAGVMMLFAAAHLTWQVRHVNLDSPQDCLAKFRSNRETGLLVLMAAIFAANAVR